MSVKALQCDEIVLLPVAVSALPLLAGCGNGGGCSCALAKPALPCRWKRPRSAVVTMAVFSGPGDSVSRSEVIWEPSFPDQPRSREGVLRRLGSLSLAVSSLSIPLSCAHLRVSDTHVLWP